MWFWLYYMFSMACTCCNKFTFYKSMHVHFLVKMGLPTFFSMFDRLIWISLCNMRIELSSPDFIFKTFSHFNEYNVRSFIDLTTTMDCLITRFGIIQSSGHWLIHTIYQAPLVLPAIVRTSKKPPTSTRSQLESFNLDYSFYLVLLVALDHIS